MKRITISLTDHQLQKLERLAKAKTAEGRGVYTIDRCIRDFAESCVPGGDGWKPPSTPREVGA